MSAILPATVQCNDFVTRMLDHGLTLVNRGKVRDIFCLPGRRDQLLFVPSDRVSSFDRVLPWLIQDKGVVLNILTVFWLTKVLTEVSHHMVAFGSAIDSHLPRGLEGDQYLQARAMVIQNLPMLPIECVVRGYLTGSGLADYRATGEVCGYGLPPGLRDGDKLPGPIFTPATKAASGHDENISAAVVHEMYGGWVAEFALSVYRLAYAYALERGIIIVDTKFELSHHGVVADEVLTPDSSRFVKRDDWERSREQGGMPPPFDKQIVRDAVGTIELPTSLTHGQRVKLKDMDPADPAQMEWLEGLEAPAGMIEKTQGRYREICSLLTGMSVEQCKAEILQIGQ